MRLEDPRFGGRDGRDEGFVVVLSVVEEREGGGLYLLDLPLTEKSTRFCPEERDEGNKEEEGEREEREVEERGPSVSVGGQGSAARKEEKVGGR